MSSCNSKGTCGCNTQVIQTELKVKASTDLEKELEENGKAEAANEHVGIEELLRRPDIQNARRSSK